MISEIKGDTLAKILNYARLAKIEPNLARMEIVPTSTKTKSGDPYYKNYYMVDFYEWLKVVEQNTYLQEEILQYKFIEDNISKYKNFIYLTTRIIDIDSKAELISKYISYEVMKDFIKMYEIFMSHMEEVQIVFLDSFLLAQNTSNPVAFIPWSYGLNRICSDLIIVKEGITDNSTLKKEANKVEGNSNIYKATLNKLNDNTQREILQSPVKLVHFEVDTTTEDLLPPRWTNIFDKVVRRELQGYAPRLELIKSLYSQYVFVGLNEIKELTVPNIGLINYPFLLKDTRDNKSGLDKIEVKCELENIGEVTLPIKVRK